MPSPLSLPLVGPDRAAEPPVHTLAYDGPLDLLLMLIRREGLLAREVPVAEVCQDWLAHLDTQAALDVDGVGDYLVLAAALCQLKARELLPATAALPALEEEDELDPRETVLQRLLEYQRYKEAAEALNTRPVLGRDTFQRLPEEDDRASAPVDSSEDALGLLRLYYQLLEARSAGPGVHQVEMERLRFQDRARAVGERLAREGALPLSTLLAEEPDRGKRIFRFLVVLEMCRLRWAGIAQERPLGPVEVRLGPAWSDDAMDKLLESGWTMTT